MSKVITLSRTFPAYHPKAGLPTYFVEQVLNALKIPFRQDWYYSELERLNAGNPKITPEILEEVFISIDWKNYGDKLHTIRAKTVRKSGEVVSRWKAGDKASLRVWSGKPYNSPQIIIAPDVELVKVYDFHIRKFQFFIDNKLFYIQHGSIWHTHMEKLCANDGLSFGEMLSWFKVPCYFAGQILCWKEVSYV